MEFVYVDGDKDSPGNTDVKSAVEAIAGVEKATADERKSPKDLSACMFCRRHIP